jgi:hypothetical protein
MRLDLNSPTLAQYHWATMFCRFSPSAPVEKDTFLTTIVSAIDGAAHWKNEEEFRATVALLHELSHLAQDLTTGLGHSDFVTHRVETPSLLRYASLVVEMDGPDARAPYRQIGSYPWYSDTADRYVEGVWEKLRYYPVKQLPGNRAQRLRALMEAELPRKLSDTDFFSLSLQSLLESDAALMVLLTLRELEQTPQQRAILRPHLQLIDPFAIGDEYWQARHHLASIIAHHCALGEEQVERVINAVFGVFVDSSLACPPHAWIEQQRHSPDEYDPAVKYVRLLTAFQKLAGQTMIDFWQALEARDYLAAEALLLAHASWRYPSAKQVYETWRDQLAPLCATSFAATIRHDACNFRLAHGTLQRRRDIDLLFGMQAPVLFLDRSHGFVKHDWGNRIVQPDENYRMTRELVDQFTTMELADFLFRTGEFRCPHAAADTCPVVEDGCVAGLVHLAQFPTSHQCAARSRLAQSGIAMP